MVLWTRSLELAAVFLAIMAIGILSLRWQHIAWISHIRRQYAGEAGKFYIDEPPIPWRHTVRNTVIAVAVSIVLAFILKDQFGLTFWQYLLMAFGFNIFYRDTRFFGSSATYIITATGIGIRLVPGHIDYRLFLPFQISTGRNFICAHIVAATGRA